MFNEDGKLIIIQQYPSPQLMPFLNPICKGTYESLPRIYGRKGRKRYLMNIKDFFKLSSEKTCLRQCCSKQNSEDEERPITKIKRTQNFQRHQIFSQSKLEKITNKKQICSSNSLMDHLQHRKKNLDKNNFNKTKKLKKTNLPLLKQFQPDDLESQHKIVRVNSGALDENSGMKNLIRQSQQLSSKFQERNSRCEHRYKLNNSSEKEQSEINEKQLKIHNNLNSSRLRLSHQSDKYYQYLENAPKTANKTSNKTKNRTNSDSLSFSSQILKNKNQATVFQTKKGKQELLKSMNNQKAYSILSNGLFKIPEEDQFTDYLKCYKPMNPSFNHKKLVTLPKFTIVPAEGYVYFGQVQNQMKNGQGITVTEKEIFQGNYKNNVKITGCEKNMDGVYTGEFLNGKRFGKGKFVWYNGEKFEGQWENNKKQGFGIWQSPKGDYYEGNWSNNRQSGKGIFKHKGGSNYEGSFKDFLKHGKGREQFLNGDIYEGEYFEGKPNGKGIYYWANGDQYEGQFKSGCREGQGKLRKKDSETYIGSFFKDQKHGEGKQSYKTGEHFEGKFERNQRKEGILFGKNGKQIQIHDEV